MATITINIPTDKEQWVMDGLAIRYGYQDMVENPSFNPEEPVDAVNNPMTIANPETLPEFCKRMVIYMIKNEANTGHNQESMEANAVEANTVELT